MRALTVQPGKADSLGVASVPDPTPTKNELLVRGVAVGICATDREIAGGDYGWAPEGSDRLVLGHESLGQVESAPDGSDFRPGDLVVGVVRRPDPVPCGACAHGEFDMCRNGQYTERGIKSRDGYASELWTVETDYAVRLDPELGETGVLMEPTTVVAKAWEQIEAVGRRGWFEPRRVLITGAGPIGLLGALLAAQRDLDVHVLDVVSTGRKPDLVRALGATYHSDGLAAAVAGAEPDIVLEATGMSSVVFEAIRSTAAYGIVCLTGVSSAGRSIRVDGGALNQEIVLQNDVVIGSVNANLRHYQQAASALARADREWLDGLITRRPSLERAADAFSGDDDDVKITVMLNGGSR
jgi:threonine dehydrogenase-like Zn-dependent dehydrogenase